MSAALLFFRQQNSHDSSAVVDVGGIGTHIETMFEIYQSPNNQQFYFRLKAKNHQIILASEGYETKASAKGGIKSVQKNAANVTSFTLKEAKDGRFYFTLDARNGESIGASQMYKSTRSRKRGIASVIANAPTADVKDLC